MKKTMLVHRHCGARVMGGSYGTYCPRCRKWLVGPAVDQVRRRRSRT